MSRLRTPLLTWCLLCLSTAAPLSVAAGSGAGKNDAEGCNVDGRIRLDGLQGAGVRLKAADVKLVLNGGQHVTFPRTDGSFSFRGVPAGTHLLEVVSMGAFFPPVRLDVSARTRGQVRAVYAENQREPLPEPLVLHPVRVEEYFEKREPFSLYKLMFTPVGMMVGFVAVVVLVLPRLMDSIDPEEMKQMQEEMRNRPQPSLSGLLAGGSK